MTVTRLLARLRHLDLQSKRLVDGLLSGNYHSVFRGPGLEFAEVRAYSDTDDPRSIDWNVSSRLGSTYTKTYREERELNVFMVVDSSASVRSGLAASSLRQAMDQIFTLFALAALNNQDRLGACFFSDRLEQWVEPAKGRNHVLRLIQDQVHRQPRGEGSNLELALRTAAFSLKRRGVVVILSDFKTTGYLTALGVLARKHDVIPVRFIPPEELAFPGKGLVHLEDPESHAILAAFGGSGRFRQAWHDWWASQRRTWIKECRKRGATPLEISTSDDVTLRLVQFFERRRRHR